MTNKHTPGPWICDGKTIKSIHHQRRYAVARVWNVLFTEEANDANAALIASAPDLLAERDRLREVNAELVAALEILATSTAYYFRDFQHLHPSIAEPLNNARSAIAKAEGAQS